MKFLNKIKYFVIIFIILETVAICFLYDNTTTKNKLYLSKKTNELQIAYSAIISGYKRISQTVFDEIINKPEVITIFKDAYTSDGSQKNKIRNKLYKNLSVTYSDLNKNNSIYIHFILPDCTSFLRFYKPEKFGDTLAKSRSSIKTVNLTKTPVNGFEIGSLYHGYRYLYPLFNKDAYIGSVEIGISSFALQNEIEKIFPAKVNFIFKKEIIEKTIFDEERKKYDLSALSENYYSEKSDSIPDKENESKIFHFDDINKIDPLIKNKIKNNIDSGQAFSISAKSEKENYIVSFLPVSNYEGCEVAFIVSYMKDTAILEYQKNFHIELTLITFLLIVIISFVYYINHSIKLLKINRNFLQNITDNMSEGLMVLDRKHNIISLNPAGESILHIYKHEVLKRNIANIINYKDRNGDILPSEKWPIFEYINYGLSYKAKLGYFIYKGQKEVLLELSARPRYQDGNLVGFLIVFEINDDSVISSDIY